MTARHQLRIGSRRLGRDRTAIDASPAPKVGETLQAARERKGVDLYRAERDTKIRLRYLASLEDDAYDDLPAPVYTKGFLRNYAIYLGLDADELLERWRDEMETRRAAERVVITAPPQPIAAPGRRVTITPGMFVGGLVVLVILGFFGYLGIQLMRYVETTPVAVTQPRDLFSTIDAEKIVLQGTSGPGALITIRGPGNELYTTTANEEGEWSEEVSLARGRNDFTITSTDPVTQRVSDPPAQLTINVPLPTQAPSAPATAAPTFLLAMTLTTPADGFVSADGNVVVTGSTSGSRITIASTYLGQPVATAPPSGAPGSPGAPATVAPTLPPAPEPTDEPAPSGSPGPSASQPPIGPARDITVPDSGTFSETLSFPIGRWELTVTTYGIGVAPLTQTRVITVSPPAVSGLVLVVNVARGNSWVRVTADGDRVSGFGTLRTGDSRTVTALSEICLRTGNAGALQITLNGLDLGLLGRSGEVGSWVFRPGLAPERLDAEC